MQQHSRIGFSAKLAVRSETHHQFYQQHLSSSVLRSDVSVEKARLSENIADALSHQ